MAQTKAQRQEAARKAAETRRKNQQKLEQIENEQPNPHEVKVLHDTNEVAHEEAHQVPRDFPTNWNRASDLEAPPPRPGFVQRWIRTATSKGNDPRNANKKFREGWRPRKASTVPGGFQAPTIAHGQFGEVIGVEEMILCEMPIKLSLQRQAFYEGKTAKQTEAIEKDLHRVERPGMPIRYGNRTKVERGQGPRVPKVQGTDAFADDPDFQD